MKTLLNPKTLVALLLACGGLTLMSSTEINVQPKAAWVAPTWADTIKNPLKDNAESVAAGKKIYSTYCVVCHGAKGKGDGIAASGLNPRPADHTCEQCQKQSDGALFWKLTNGRPPMASYAKTLTVQQRWQVVNFMRTLKQK